MIDVFCEQWTFIWFEITGRFVKWNCRFAGTCRCKIVFDLPPLFTKGMRPIGMRLNQHELNIMFTTNSNSLTLSRTFSRSGHTYALWMKQIQATCLDINQVFAISFSIWQCFSLKCNLFTSLPYSSFFVIFFLIFLRPWSFSTHHIWNAIYSYLNVSFAFRCHSTQKLTHI